MSLLISSSVPSRNDFAYINHAAESNQSIICNIEYFDLILTRRWAFRFVYWIMHIKYFSKICNGQYKKVFIILLWIKLYENKYSFTLHKKLLLTWSIFYNIMSIAWINKAGLDNWNINTDYQSLTASQLNFHSWSANVS